MLHKKIFLKASFFISIAIILSRVLGMVREQYSLYLFGAGWELDAYISASKIPNVFRNLLGEGAFSAVFITMFTQIHSQDRRQAMEFTNRVLSYLILLSVGLSVLGIVGAPFYLGLFHKSAVNLPLAIHLTSFIMPFLIFISLSAIFMGILNSWQIYFIPALAPFFGNLAFLLLVFLLHKKYGVLSLSLAFLGSSITYVLIQIPILIRKKFRFRFDFHMDKNLKYFFLSFIPVAFGMAVFQLNRIISNVFSSSIEGGNTIFEKAFIVTQLILSVFITGISTALLPLLAKEDRTRMEVIYIDSLRLIFLVILPAGIFFLVLDQELSSFIYRDILVALGLGTGRISQEAIKGIGQMLFYFAPGILFFGLITIVNRGFQGLKMFYYPLAGSVVSVILNFFLMRFLVPRLGINGIPIAISIASFFNLTVLMILFHLRNKVSYKKFFLTVAKAMIAGTGLLFSLLALKKIPLPPFFRTPFLLATGSIIYLVGLLILQERETTGLYRAVKRRLKLKTLKQPSE